MGVTMSSRGKTQMNMRTVAAAAALLTIAACGGGSSSSEPKAGSTTPSTAAVTAVSMQTTCDELFLDGDPRLWSRAVDLVAKASNEQTWILAEADTVAERLHEVGAPANAELQPHVQQMASAVDYLDGVDVPAFKRAAREVANTCTPYVAMDG